MELLAPAGSFQALKQAVYNGADAVYFGYTELNARANAENITDMTKAVGFCHLFNVKAFLTLNITIKDSEIDLATDIIKQADKAHIDAIIISDLALLPIIKEIAPNVEVHASTQMGIHNRYGAMLLEKMGFDRIILSREVSLRDIKDIKTYTNIPLEVFVQGAICIGFSGGCLFSSMLSGKSGNRGRCLQLCRQNYDAYIDENKAYSGYLLSAKDLCLIDKLRELKDAGVSSLKIEGRLKRIEYVAGCVKEYRKALDYGFNGDYNVLKNLFNRGNYTCGYEYDKNIVYPYAPNHIGIPRGIVIEQSNGNIVIGVNQAIQKEDGYKILRQKVEIGGFTGKGAVNIDDDKSFFKEHKKYHYFYKLKNTMSAREGDIISITSNTTLNNQLTKAIMKLKIDLEICLNAEQNSYIKAKYKQYEVAITGNKVEKANKLPLTHEEIKHQFSKLGNTDFELGEIKIESENAFVAKSELNELKRQVISLLREKIINCYKRNKSRTYKDIFNNKSIAQNNFPKNNNRIFVEIKNLSQYAKILDRENINIVYSPDNFDYKDCVSLYNKLKNEGNKIYIKLPIFSDFLSINYLKDIITTFDGLICNNYYAIMLSLEYNKSVVLGFNMNITNNRNPLLKICDDYIVSPELNAKEINSFDGILYSFGNLPLMYMLQCPRKTIGLSCNNCNGKLVFKDKKGYYIIDTIKINGNKCLHVLKNGIKTDIGSKLSVNHGVYLDFTTTNSNDINDVFRDYSNNSRISQGKYTLNHLKRGIE